MLGDSKEQDLAEQGFCVIPKVLSGEMLNRLKKYCSDGVLAETSNDNFGESGGFIRLDYKNSLVAELLAWPKTLENLHDMGFNDIKLHSYYISTKPSGSKDLPWHSDLFYEYNKRQPAELFLIYYLQDTYPENGCLRVIPGSHLWSRQKLQEQSGEAGVRGGEVDVPVKAGDLFIGDRRILHATHANNSDQWRTCITIAYAPDFKSLPAEVKKIILHNKCLPPLEHRKNPGEYDIDRRLRPVLPV